MGRRPCCAVERSRTVREAIEAASEPMLGKLSGVVDAASKAEGKLRAAVASFSWKWIATAIGAAAGGIGALFIAAWFVVWWQRHQIENLTEQRFKLQVEITQLETNAKEWEKRAGRAKLTMCGKNGSNESHLCVRVDTKAGMFGQESDFMILNGY
jgi:hypothetical protein